MLLPLLVSILAMTDTEPPAFFAANEELRAYVLEAGENQPGLLARYHVWRATLQRIPQAGGLDVGHERCAGRAHATPAVVRYASCPFGPGGRRGRRGARAVLYGP